MSEHLGPAEAAARLGVSTKALRLYERRGLVAPLRTSAGWRVYGPDQLIAAARVAALRSLGLTLSQAGRVLAGDLRDLTPVLAAHEAELHRRIGELSEAARRTLALRRRLAEGEAVALDEVLELATEPARKRRNVGRGASLALDLPWPWAGERLVIQSLAPLTWLTGPLGSGKTRLAVALAEAAPGGRFLGLERTPAELHAALDEDGASGLLVVDLVEEDMTTEAQVALARRLRARGPDARPLVLMTRSTAMLDLDLVGPHEAILYCPASHAPPFFASPRPGVPGHEALRLCLAPPEVRARSQGMIATFAAA
ncbi:MAG: MerR family transcriptional regulator [Caulobacter sp.]|jgi:DNA-binding transcriptional MerR regulator